METQEMIKKIKPRSKNFMEFEDCLLRRFIEPFKAVLLLKKCDKVTNNAKANAWTEICKRFNNATTYEPRTTAGLKFRFKMMKHCERSGKRLSAQIPYRPKKIVNEFSDTENETIGNEKRSNWIEYIDEVKSEEQMKEHIQDNIIEEDADDGTIEDIYEIQEEDNVVPIKNSESLSLSDQLILANIRLIQTQRELALREIRYVDEKTKYLQNRIKGCQCPDPIP